MSGPKPPDKNWYTTVADHLGSAYLGFEFAQGTEQEVDFLYNALSLTPGARLLDVGTGPGRHAVEFAKRGVQVVGIDISSTFLGIARERASEAGAPVSFFEMDALALPFEDEFDVAISICEGAFGLGLDDLKILRGMTAALKPGGHAAVAAPNTFYVLNRVGDRSEFDPVTSLFRRTMKDVPGADGSTKDLAMWSSCYTPRELEWIANGAGLDPEIVNGIAPGAFGADIPTFEHPELLLLARKPA
ncbi:MAG TPA: class I SAM-dependent methyltransferase [Actinomycetota bacterium]|nr:class I SAM-dependent methyltransferase [Actinomycetota bacterium]